MKHATRLASQLRKNHVPVEWMVRSDEGHGFRHWKNTVDLYRTMEKFLADPDPKKRERKVDELLGRKEFTDLWALKWSYLDAASHPFPVPAGFPPEVFARRGGDVIGWIPLLGNDCDSYGACAAPILWA